MPAARRYAAYRAQGVAEELSSCGSSGDRAAILAPQGLDYIVAFFATVGRFTERFARFKFNASMIRPSYGLAEAGSMSMARQSSASNAQPTKSRPIATFLGPLIAKNPVYQNVTKENRPDVAFSA